LRQIQAEKNRERGDGGRKKRGETRNVRRVGAGNWRSVEAWPH